ncbi:MAG TPA: TetR/AcrR family transcriptional regulator [Streptosporangiaceae bacterium]|nr:TetR/AcrR family transcriptional regulator [Streptosporangiaceae bacterium]
MTGASATESTGSARQAELLELAYRYTVEHGLTELSLRPLAKAIGSSPRVLLYLFGSKDELIRALLARSRADELALLDQVRGAGLAEVITEIWAWLAADAHRGLLNLWVEAYGRSLTEPDGPWAGFAAATVTDWLALLASAQPAARRETAEGAAERTLALAVLRGALLDLLATGDADRATAAVRRYLSSSAQDGADG